MAETLRRVLRLLNLLQSRPVWTGTELAAELGVTTRSVRRDVQRLRDLGYPVSAEQGVGGGYLLAAGRALPPLLLDDDEAIAVAVGLRLATGGSVGGVGEAAVRAMAKLDQVLPSRLRGSVDAVVQSTVSLDGSRDVAETVSAETLVDVARAIRTPERIVFAYAKAYGAESDLAERRAEPYRLVSAGRRWYLMAYDVDREDWRTFRLDRMGPVRRTGWRFPAREAPDPVEFVGKAISQRPYPAVTKIRIEAPAETVRARVPAAAATIEPDGPDACVLTAGASSSDFVAFHVARLGLPARILESVGAGVDLQRLGRQLLDMAGERPGDAGGQFAPPSP
ncbi:helix-turn-helix transcriptional regulator [Zhihengliuella halotolerans]|uniref:Putative DNA-binding transcriptional regulator YafY n=1 Tax=Zhihengliuella halotolerans TaxID=370736 RepID=A0A4Q8AIP9_9MICC|nr:WYL domain-containing protein [Zhihengliuella halotolerans]RZU63665.1 putative DNA-binding transcriptional regulator YafY [Zhihengliuella halotolerans]